VRCLDTLIISVALLAFSIWPLLARLVMPEALNLGRALLVVQALVSAVCCGKALGAWRFIHTALEEAPWRQWPYYEAFCVGSPAMARAAAPKRRALGRGWTVAILLVAISMLVIVPAQHVALLSCGQLRDAPVSLYAGAWKLYQVEWEGRFVIPLVDAGDDAIWVYVVTYEASAGPGAITGDWAEWAEGIASQLTGRVLNEMWQNRDPNVSEGAWRTEAAAAFGEAEMMAAFADVIEERVEEAYEIELSRIGVTCELWTVAQYIKEVR
jgi:hypothetical protein